MSDVPQIISDIRVVQREINFENEKLSRTITIADETVYSVGAAICRLLVARCCWKTVSIVLPLSFTHTLFFFSLSLAGRPFDFGCFSCCIGFFPRDHRLLPQTAKTPRTFKVSGT